MRKTEKTILNGTAVEVTQWGSREASRNMLVLSRFFGDALGSTSTIRERLVKGDFSALATLFGKLGQPDDMLALCDALAPCTKVAGGPEGTPAGSVMLALKDWDDHFAGDLSGMIEWLVFGLRVNYADFLAGLLAKASEEKTPETSESPSTSTG
jgi:hypothetical protein